MFSAQAISSALYNGITCASSWAMWGMSKARDVSHSAGHYIQGILSYQHHTVVREEQRVETALSVTERTIAEGAAGTVKGTVAAVIIYSGASWPVIALIAVGLLPKNTTVRFGKTVLGKTFPTAWLVHEWSNNVLAIAHGRLPARWIQVGVKAGSDTVVGLIGSGSLTHFYRNHHIGERIWLWTGALASVRTDLSMLPSGSRQMQRREYHSPG